MFCCYGCFRCLTCHGLPQCWWILQCLFRSLTLSLWLNGLGLYLRRTVITTIKWRWDSSWTAVPGLIKPLYRHVCIKVSKAYSEVMFSKLIWSLAWYATCVFWQDYSLQKYHLGVSMNWPNRFESCCLIIPTTYPLVITRRMVSLSHTDTCPGAAAGGASLKSYSERQWLAFDESVFVCQIPKLK